MGRRPIKLSKASTAVFALHGTDIKSFLPLFFSKKRAGLGAEPHINPHILKYNYNLIQTDISPTDRLEKA
jgi:hypothetical protein